MIVGNLQRLLHILAARTEFAVLEVDEWPCGLIYEELELQAGFLLKKHEQALKETDCFESALNIVKKRPVCSLVDFVEAVFCGFLVDSYLMKVH